MYSFLVLGLVPGTDIQISFTAWLILMPILVVVFLICRPLIRYYMIPRPQLVQMRVPLHANQLHRRG